MGSTAVRRFVSLITASARGIYWARGATIITLLTALAFCIPGPVVAGGESAGDSPQIRLAACLSCRDAVIISRCDGSANRTVLFEKNSRKNLIPASILKVVTSLAAFHYLGDDFRFKTAFYRTDDADLVVKGYGDPCFVSTEIERAAKAVGQKMTYIRHIIVDDAFFAPTIDVPGRQKFSWEPYDAPNSALCANYNSVALARRNGTYVSAEPETPLLPFALTRFEKQSPPLGRILLVNNQAHAPLYAGELMAWFLKKQGCQVSGDIKRGRVDGEPAVLLLKQVSAYALPEVVRMLLKHSNNFIANQLLLRCGAEVYGPPATLPNGVRAVQSYMEDVLGITTPQLVEGSGLSRENRISAADLNRALVEFFPYRDLMRADKNGQYKTGTLRGINTRTGYIKNNAGMVFSYVLIINTPGKSVDAIMPVIKKVVDSVEYYQKRQEIAQGQ